MNRALEFPKTSVGVRIGCVAHNTHSDPRTGCMQIKIKKILGHASPMFPTGGHVGPFRPTEYAVCQRGYHTELRMNSIQSSLI